MSNLEKVFMNFHARNPQVWCEFKRLAFDAMEKGHRHYSAYLIIETIRWESNLGTTKINAFKIPNTTRPYYARLFHASFPQLKGFFKTRELEDFDPDVHGTPQKELEL